MLALRELYFLKYSLLARPMFISARALKRSQYSHARECSKRPLVIPIKESLTFPYALHGRAFLALVVVT